jgi:single-strand DNA-binding protein
MSDLNQCNFIGRLPRDPETRYTKDGKAVANFTIAVNEAWKKDGQKQESTTWVRIVAFGPLGEICSKYLQKGSQVFVSGKLTERKWQDQSGQTRYTSEIVARDMQVLGKPGQTERPPQSAPQSTSQGGMDFNDEIPFARRHWLEA